MRARNLSGLGVAMTNPIPLEPGKFYHIYNRGNNRENIFSEERNYAHFLKLYAYHVGPIANTYAYCLLHNHFHLFVRAKDQTGFLTSSGEVSAEGQFATTDENLTGLSRRHQRIPAPLLAGMLVGSQQPADRTSRRVITELWREL